LDKYEEILNGEKKTGIWNNDFIILVK
jgi:hypothetical protein